MENVSEFSGKNQEFGPSAEKWQDRKSKRTSWKTREENGLEISDRERASDILGFPLGGAASQISFTMWNVYKNAHMLQHSFNPWQAHFQQLKQLHHH